MMSRIKAMFNERGGVNAVELIILIAFIALAIILGATALGGAINDELTGIGTAVDAASTW